MTVVTGSGGGVGKSGAASGGTIAQNTLRSNSLARIVELISEGEIEGLVNGAQSIYFNETPLQNADGTYNFGGLFTFNSDSGTYDPVTQGTVLTGDDQWIPGVSWDQRVGLPDQDVLNGYASSETSTSVEQQIRNSIGPIVRTIEDANTTAIKVVIRVPNLSFLDTNTGDLNAASVAWTVEIAPAGGAYVLAQAVSLDNQKCTSPYEHQSLLQLPAGGAPWNVRVTRLTADSELDINLQNDTWWESYTEVVQGQFIYPNTALIALTISAEFFGTSIPTRGYHVKGLKTDVPSNWDPITRLYTGVWDGTFVKAWHNNPAWVLYALLTNDRWGIGEFINAATVDKWGLYQIATYCDELVPSGFFDPQGAPIMEPRFVYNGVINTREEAYKVLQTVATAFRGMAYWSLGQVFAVGDMPTDAITTVSPANVIGGHFNYSGTAMKARHSVAMVSWNDPTDFYRPAIEVVQNDAMIQRFGWRQVDVVAAGCTSRGQANRYGRWILETEENETETVDFVMSWDGYVLQDGTTLAPGHIILVADPRKTGGARIGGRLTSVTSNTVVTIDAPFVPTPGDSYTLTVMQPDGSIETQSIGAFDVTNTILTLDAPLSQVPQVNTMWVIQGTDVNPRPYRVLSVQEQDSHLFKITALFNDPTKYARVENNIALAAPVYTRPTNVMNPPSNATAIESNYFSNGAPQSRVTVSWTAPSGAMASKYHVTADSPRGAVDFGLTVLTSIDLFNVVPGDWVFYIAAQSVTGLQSINLPIAITIAGWSAADAPTAASLSILGGGTTFAGTAPTITWANTFPADSVVYPITNTVRIYDVVSNVLLRTEQVDGLVYTYSLEDNLNDGGPRRSLIFTVTAQSLLGVEQATPASITVTNPPPAAITPNVSTTGITITAAWSVTDTDYLNSMVWVSTINGFDPTIVPAVYEGPDTSITVNQPAPGTSYVRVGAYDQFGKSGMIVGPQVAIVCTGSDIAQFNSQLHDYVVNQLADINDSIQTTQGVIAAAASEQDAANWTDKYNIKTIINEATAGLNSATVTAISVAEANAAAALASYELVVNAQLNGTPALVTIDIANPALIHWPAHGFFAGQGVSFTTTGALPSHIVSGTVYYIIPGGLGIDSFEIAATIGGAAISTLGDTQSGVHTGTPQGFSAGITTNATATANLNGKFAAQWTVTLDVNGYVSGIQAFNDGSTSNITMITDNFQVVSPSHLNGTPHTVTIDIASPALVHLAAHGYAAGQPVKFTTTGALPSGLISGTQYYVIAAGLVTGAFEVSATLGGSAVITTGTQSGTHTCTPAGGGAPIAAFAVSTVNGVPQIALAGAMIADGVITAKAINVSTLSAISANIGTVTAGIIQDGAGKLIIDLGAQTITGFQ